MPHLFAPTPLSTASRRRPVEDLTRCPPGLAAREGANDAELIAWIGAGDRAAFDVMVARQGDG
jgi:hypothetical protein